MDLIISLLTTSSTWLFILGIFLVVFVLKVVKNIVATIASLGFTLWSLFKIYVFLSDKI